MGSEQVASVLRQSGAHVRLIVARGVMEPSPDAPAHAPIIPTHQLDEHLHMLNATLIAVDHEHLAQLAAENGLPQGIGPDDIMAQIHQVCIIYHTSHQLCIYHQDFNLIMSFLRVLPF